MDFTTAGAETYEEQRVTFREAVGGAETLEHGYRRKTRWIPTGMRATFERYRYGGGEWGSWRMISGRVYGHNVRADGSPGAQHFERLNGYGNDLSGAAWVTERLAVMAKAVEAHGVDQSKPEQGDDAERIVNLDG